MTVNTQLNRYTQEGYVVVPNLISADEVRLIQQEISHIAANHRNYPQELVQTEPLVQSGKQVPESFELGIRKLFRVARHSEFFRSFAFHQSVVEIAKELVGPDLFLAQSMTLMKSPGVSSPKVWHQDNAYFRLDPPDVVGFWIATDPATVENGCMHILPGSHRNGIVEHAGEGDAYGIVDVPQNDDVIAIPLNPGDALVFHGELQHYTPANLTSRRRRSVQYHYASSQANWLGPVNDSPYFDPEVQICGRPPERS
ncbi:MAG: phytanoyl-CoA dioxygenase family protein [Fuerstiella sp.]|nr:phytanoyl-CoA dioxygenase family protein [Fuerstiella sp.]